MTKSCVTVLSGGVDSSTLAYHLSSEGWSQIFLSFDYGQSHRRELLCARWIADSLPSRHHVIHLSDVAAVLPSAITTPGREIPEGHYAKANMAQTVVPNRNAIMLSIAWGVMIANSAQRVFYGAHAGDHEIYPDCRWDFILALQSAFSVGSDGYAGRIEAPFVSWTKTEIVKHGLRLNVPYEHTWTCYKGAKAACGRCGACVERLQSFEAAGASDPLEYADTAFWKQAIREFERSRLTLP